MNYYNDYDEYDNEYDEYDDLYCDYDDLSGKLVERGYSSVKKVKRKVDPVSKSVQIALKLATEIDQITNEVEVTTKVIAIINGKGLFVGTLSSNGKTEALHSSTNNFRSGKHKKGGQSSARFGRLYDNKMNAFVKKCAETIRAVADKKMHITIGGNGNLKKKLARLMKIKDKTVSTKKGGKAGFEEICDKMVENDEEEAPCVEEISDMIKMDKSELLSFGIVETVKAIKHKIAKSVVLAEGEGCYKYVLKKRKKVMKLAKTKEELSEAIKEMKCKIGKKWKVIDFCTYVRKLCKKNKVELKIVNSTEVARDFCGCVGTLRQSLQYL